MQASLIQVGNEFVLSKKQMSVNFDSKFEWSYLIADTIKDAKLELHAINLIKR
jgi:hypothetical protein